MKPPAKPWREGDERARERAISVLEAKGYEIVNTLFTDEWYSQESMKERGVVQIPLCFLAKSLENMSLCHAAFFCKGWEQARGCTIEPRLHEQRAGEGRMNRENSTEPVILDLEVA